MGYAVPATPDHAAQLAPNLRPADRREVQALTGLPPEIVLPQVLRPNTMAGFTDMGELAVLFGADPVPGFPEVGVIWMVANDVIVRRPLEFHQSAKAMLAQFHRQYPLLTNVMDERNTVHRRWLSLLGFSFVRRIEQWGAESRPFLEFARLHDPCA